MFISPERIKVLSNPGATQGRGVVYWMQQSQRSQENYALEYGLEEACSQNDKFAVIFCLDENFPDANLRHFDFMLNGLKETMRDLQSRKIAFYMLRGDPENIIPLVSKYSSKLILDSGYTPVQRKWRESVVQRSECPIYEIDNDTVVPVRSAYPKMAYSAAVLRRSLKPFLNIIIPEFEYFNHKLPQEWKLPELMKKFEITAELEELDKLIEKLKIQKFPAQIKDLKAGTSEAKKQLEIFINRSLDFYHLKRNDPARDYQSHMSPYLHFGQISPLYILGKIQGGDSPGAADYLEQLVIRRELAFNYACYNKDCDSFKGLPAWAQETLKKHSSDPREYVYSIEQLEQGKTHDVSWNCAQNEMAEMGRMHGYMRMYWAKKIIEWTPDPVQAFERALYLNNKYFLDGRDPNSYAGIAWTFGAHDRPWKERAIFGKIRYMNEKGLKRKFNMQRYLKRIRCVDLD